MENLEEKTNWEQQETEIEKRKMLVFANVYSHLFKKDYDIEPNDASEEQLKEFAEKYTGLFYSLKIPKHKIFKS